MPSQDDAIQRASDAARLIKQGEVLSLSNVCLTTTHPLLPIDAAAREAIENDSYALAEEPLLVTEPVDEVVVLTQTCDLQRTSVDVRYCQVAPVLRNQNPALVHMIARGRKPGWAAIPWLDDSSIADLARISTIERSLLVDVRTMGSPATPGQEFDFATAVSRHFSRPALPEAVVDVLRILTDRIKARHGRQSSEGRSFTRVRSLRVEAIPGFDDPSPELRLLFILDEQDLPSLSPGVDVDHSTIDSLVQLGPAAASEAAMSPSLPALAAREAWIALTEVWAAAAKAAAEQSTAVASLEVEVLNASELSFARSEQAPELDFFYLSTPPD